MHWEPRLRCGSRMKCGSGKRTRSSTNGRRRARGHGSRRTNAMKMPICSAPSVQAAIPASRSSCRTPTPKPAQTPQRDKRCRSARRTRPDHSRPSRLAHHAQAQGSEKPHPGVAPARMSGAQCGGEHLAIPAPDLSLEPCVQEPRRHSRRLSGRMAQAPRRDRSNRLHRHARLGNHRSIIVKAGIRPSNGRAGVNLP